MSGSNLEGEQNEGGSQNPPLEGHEVRRPVFVQLDEDPLAEGREIPPHMAHVIEEDHTEPALNYQMQVAPPNAARAPFFLPQQRQLQGRNTNPHAAGDGGRGAGFRPLRPIESGRGDGGAGILPLADLLRLRFVNQQQHQGGPFLRPRGPREPNPEH